MSWKRINIPMMVCLPVLLGLMVLAVAQQRAEAQDDAGKAGAELTGVIKFDGPRPERLPIDMTPRRGGSRDECSVLHKTPALSEVVMVGEDGGLANVFVYVKKGLEKKKEYAMPTKPAVLDQMGCMYNPRVQGVRVGQDLVIRNSDKLTHNTRSYAFRNRAFNIAQPADSEERTKVFKRPERAIQMGCDIHGWMKAFVFAMDHPYFAVTDEKGQFKIAGLPAGEYTVAAWHEELGEQDAKITVPASGSQEVAFSFKKKAK
jgi:hypothetical protein